MLKGLDIVLLFGSIVVQLFWCPFSKVEESFNVQATHDFIYVSPRFNEFDHVFFPGVVPRSFLASAVLGFIGLCIKFSGRAIYLCSIGLSFPEAPSLDYSSPSSLIDLIEYCKSYFIKIQNFLNNPVFRDTAYILNEKWKLWLTLRFVMAVCVFCGYLRIRKAIRRSFGQRSARIFTIALASQFHLIFYSSRLLPNTFSMYLSSLAFSHFLEYEFNGKKQESSNLCFSYLIVSGLIFRCETLLLLIPLFLYVRWPQFKFQIVFIFLLSILLDSLLWNNSGYSREFQKSLSQFIPLHGDTVRPMWPELYVFLFNTIQNKSYLWGISPWHWYITSAIPRTIGPFTIGLLGLIKRPKLVLGFFIWAFPIIALSYLGHKEVRFIFPSLIGLTAYCAIGFCQLYPSNKMVEQSGTELKNLGLSVSLKAQRTLWRLTFLVVCAIAILSSMARFFASVYNYPGGWALKHFNESGSVVACQNGSGFSWKPNSQLTDNKVLHPQFILPPTELVKVPENLATISRTMWKEVVYSYYHPSIRWRNVKDVWKKVNFAAVPDVVPFLFDNFVRNITQHVEQDGVSNATSNRQCKLHIDVFASETGVSRYLDASFSDSDQKSVTCIIDKSQDKSETGNYDFLITSDGPHKSGFSLLFIIPQFSKYYLSQKFYIPKMKLKPSIFVFGRKIDNC